MGEILWSSIAVVATKLKPLKSWCAFALGGTPGESFGVFAVNSGSKQNVSSGLPEAGLNGG